MLELDASLLLDGADEELGIVTTLLEEEDSIGADEDIGASELLDSIATEELL